MSESDSDRKDKSGDQETATKVILLVSDPEDPTHGEIKLLDEPEKAERMVETLLEAGYEQERIRVFVGTEPTIVVTHRPVVALASDEDGEPEPQPAAADKDDGRKERGRLSDHLPSAADHAG